MPCSRCRSTFSTTTIASSTTMPTASTRPNSVRLLIENPSAAITAKVPTSDTGIAMIGMMAGRQPCRNTSTTMHDQRHRFVDRLDQLADGLRDEFGRVVADIVVEPLRKARLQPLHRVRNALGGRQRVRARPLGHQHADGRFPQQEAVGRVGQRAELDPRDVAQPDRAAVGAGLDHDLLELFGILQSAGEGKIRLERRGRQSAVRRSGHPRSARSATRIAAITSPAVRPSVAILSGSSHSRIE